jgi:uncharacterized protein YfaS (alpha-2-macroglobulin family)
MEQLASGKELPLVFAKTGAGVLSYTAVLRSAAKRMPTDAKDAGIAVQRWLEPLSTPLGKGQVTKIQAGELLRLRVRVATPAARRFVAIDVPLPSGLEPVDTGLSSTAAVAIEQDVGEEGSEEGSEEEGEGGEEAPWFWTPFNYTELRDERVVFFSDELPAGVNTAMVPVRATTPGVYVLPPATAEEMYAPEVSGRSDGGAFEVVLR